MKWIAGLTCACALCVASTGAMAEETYWQMHAGNVTVVATGDKTTPAQTASMVLRIEQTVRWVAGWPESYQPPAVMAFVLPNTTIDGYFGAYRQNPDESFFSRPKQGIVIVTPQTTVVIFALGPDRGRELEPLKFILGQTLLDAGPREHWPDCVRYGLGVIVTATNYLPDDRVYVEASDVVFPILASESPIEPAELMAPLRDVPRRAEIRNRYAYSCFVLAMMAQREDAFARARYDQYFDAIANGAPFDDAAHLAFGISDSEFTRRMKAFGYRMKSQPRTFNLSKALPVTMPDWPAAELIAPERANSLLLTLRDRLFGPAQK